MTERYTAEVPDKAVEAYVESSKVVYNKLCSSFDKRFDPELDFDIKELRLFIPKDKALITSRYDKRDFLRADVHFAEDLDFTAACEFVSDNEYFKYVTTSDTSESYGPIKIISFVSKPTEQILTFFDKNKKEVAVYQGVANFNHLKEYATQSLPYLFKIGQYSQSVKGSKNYK